MTYPLESGSISPRDRRLKWFRAESAGTDVERINQYAFYEIGAGFAELKKYKGQDDIDPRTVFFAVLDSIGKINGLISGQPIKVVVSLKAAKELGEALAHINAKYFMKDGKFHFPDDKSKKIQSWELSRVVNTLETFEHVFRAEMDGSSVYLVPARGIYSTPELIESADDAFPKELHQVIGEKALFDYRAAGRCIAFNLPTAAAFHAMRAVEAVIEIYFQTFTNQAGVTCVSWADYADKLDKCVANPPLPQFKPDKRSIDQIRQMKDADRNPVMHPRVTLTLPEADALFSSAKSVIMNMAMEVKEAWDAQKQKGGNVLSMAQALGALPKP